MEKFFVSEEKSFIGSATEQLNYSSTFTKHILTKLYRLSHHVSISSTFFARFFHTKYFLAAFSSYILALVKNLCKECARITLMKLTFSLSILPFHTYNVVETLPNTEKSLWRQFYINLKKN